MASIGWNHEGSPFMAAISSFFIIVSWETV
jgi:hypothetical protein